MDKLEWRDGDGSSVSVTETSGKRGFGYRAEFFFGGERVGVIRKTGFKAILEAVREECAWLCMKYGWGACSSAIAAANAMLWELRDPDLDGDGGDWRDEGGGDEEG